MAKLLAESSALSQKAVQAQAKKIRLQKEYRMVESKAREKAICLADGLAKEDEEIERENGLLENEAVNEVIGDQVDLGDGMIDFTSQEWEAFVAQANDASLDLGVGAGIPQ